MHQFWDKLVRLGVVSKTRGIGRAELYKLNLGSVLVKRLIELDNDISKKLIEEEVVKQRGAKVTVQT